MLNSYKIFITSVSFLCTISGYFEEEKEEIRVRYFCAITDGLCRYARAGSDQGMVTQAHNSVIQELKNAHSAGFLLIEVVSLPAPLWVLSEWNRLRSVK